MRVQPSKEVLKGLRTTALEQNNKVNMKLFELNKSGEE